ncbi:hypothetical protein AVEN_222127-1 [Araneus ventricosus]|uniref:DDE-1 domain-containing protein n=1 Tax=Araneus ventricosus TaxID=182803 RepID=A0A4Y2DUL1_ARAVE|nr:hypothetical protein AVEN_222127-1 [Araneus ventricosus]
MTSDIQADRLPVDGVCPKFDRNLQIMFKDHIPNFIPVALIVFDKNGTVQENIDLRKAIAELYKVRKFDATAKTIRNCFKRGGGFSNQTDDSDSDDEDAILDDLKEKWKTLEGNGRITDDATLSDILEVDAELLTASYPTDEEILKSLMDDNKGQENDSYSENEDVIHIGLKCYNHSKPLKEVSNGRKCARLYF